MKQKVVLVALPDRLDKELFRATLTAAGFVVIACDTASEIREEMRGPIDVFIIGGIEPHESRSGHFLMAQLVTTGRQVIWAGPQDTPLHDVWQIHKHDDDWNLLNVVNLVRHMSGERIHHEDVYVEET